MNLFTDDMVRREVENMANARASRVRYRLNDLCLSGLVLFRVYCCFFPLCRALYSLCHVLFRHLRVLARQLSEPIPLMPAGQAAAAGDGDGSPEPGTDNRDGAGSDGGEAEDDGEGEAAAQTIIHLQVRAPERTIKVKLFLENPLGELLQVACRIMKRDAARSALFFDGRRLDADKSPADYEIEDGDLIDMQNVE